MKSESEDGSVPTSRDELVGTIQREVNRTRIRTKRSYREAGVTLVALATVAWLSLEFLRTELQHIDSIAYVFAVSGTALFMLISAFMRSRFVRILIKNIPNWMGQTLMPFTLLTSVVTYGAFATLIGIVGEWRILTLPLFFLDYCLSILSLKWYVMMRMGKKTPTWKSVKTALLKSDRSTTGMAFNVFISVGIFLALVDIYFNRDELLTFKNLQGTLLLLALMALCYWLALSISVIIALTVYEDEARSLISTANVESTKGARKIRTAYVELLRDGPNRRNRETKDRH